MPRSRVSLSAAAVLAAAAVSIPAASQPAAEPPRVPPQGAPQVPGAVLEPVALKVLPGWREDDILHYKLVEVNIHHQLRRQHLVDAIDNLLAQALFALQRIHLLK